MQFVKSVIPGVSRVISNVTPLLILFVLSKFASTEEIGLLNYFIALITIVGVLTDFGLPEAVQKFVAQKKDEIEKISFTIVAEIALVLIGAVIFLIVDYISGNRISYGYSSQMFLILIFSSSNVFILIFNGLRDIVRTSVYYLLSSFVFIGLTFAIYFLNITDIVNAFLIGRLVSWIIFTIVPLVKLYSDKYIDTAKIKYDKRFVVFAANVLISTMAYTIMGQWDSILVNNYAGSYQNGIYKSVSTLASLPIVLPVILQTKFLPEFSSLVAEGRVSELKASILEYIKLLFAFCVVVFLLSLPLAHLAIRIVYTQEIADNGIQYFFPILGGVLIYIITAPILSALMALGFEYRYRNAALIQSVIFLVFSTLFIGVFGISLLPILLLLANVLFMFLNLMSLRFSLKDLEIGEIN